MAAFFSLEDPKGHRRRFDNHIAADPREHPKGKRKKLEGNTITLSLRGCDKRAEVTDEAAVPTKYKRVTVTLPAETWSWCAIRST